MKHFKFGRTTILIGKVRSLLVLSNHEGAEHFFKQFENKGQQCHQAYTCIYFIYENDSHNKMAVVNTLASICVHGFHCVIKSLFIIFLMHNLNYNYSLLIET